MKTGSKCCSWVNAKKILKIGNAQGFWGDSPSAPLRLLQQEPDLDFLTLDYLAEISLSIMAIQREKDHNLGYAQDFVNVIQSLIPLWKAGSKVKVITNAGGLHPGGCARRCAELLQKADCKKKIGVVSGDDLFPLLKQNPENPLFRNLDTSQSLATIQPHLMTANAYLGAAPLTEALYRGADIVITGRVADPSLTVAPCMARFGWTETDYNLLAGATVAGHLLECGTQVTGGICTDWLKVPDPAHIGFPFVEISPDGSFIISKPVGTGGWVTMETVKEQLLYEIGDPAHYLSPDATVSFLELSLQKQGKDRIAVQGAKGSKPPSTYKVSATYRDGFRTEGTLAILGPHAAEKAQRCGEILLQKVKEAGYILERTHIECIGAGAIVPGVIQEASTKECLLRVAVADSRQEALECFSREIASLVTSGPQGITGYTSGRPHIRPVFGYWPCLIEREKIKPLVEIL